MTEARRTERSGDGIALDPLAVSFSAANLEKRLPQNEICSSLFLTTVDKNDTVSYGFTRI